MAGRVSSEPGIGLAAGWGTSVSPQILSKALPPCLPSAPPPQVCELDIIFNFEKAYFILDEFLMGGEVQDTSKKSVLKAIEQADLLQEVGAAGGEAGCSAAPTAKGWGGGGGRAAPSSLVAACHESPQAGSARSLPQQPVWATRLL